jgi:uridine kinase
MEASRSTKGGNIVAQLNNMDIISIGELEFELGVRKWPRFITACEDAFQTRICQVADRILANPRIRAVFVSGPTASGKTTFAGHLAGYLSEKERPTRLLSLDDYYSTTIDRFDAKGRPDFESIDTLDTTQMVTDFSGLLAGDTVQLPSFDFLTRQRYQEPDKRIRLQAREVLLAEGLHGLSDLVFGQLPRDQVLGIFIMPWCTLLDGRQLLGSRDLRILRRISRDVLHRGSTALSTLDYWPMIDRTELEFFPQYLARADEYVNSCLTYEFCVIAPLASRQIEESLEKYEMGQLPGSIYRKEQKGYADLPAAIHEARELLEACERIPSADRSIVPSRSILNEFIR